MAQILLGKEVTASLNEEIEEKVKTLKEHQVMPKLGIIRIGEKQDDIAYERNAVKRCEKLSVAYEKFLLSEDVTEEIVIDTIQKLNKAEDIHGVLVFRPLPSHLDEEKILNTLAVEKDVDGITNLSMAGIFAGKEMGYAPCTASACIRKKAVIVGRSLVVGKPVSIKKKKKNATITVCHTKTKNIKQEVQAADIVVAAAGSAGFIKKEHLRTGQVVIDVGINVNEEGNLCGDVAFDEAEPIVDAITPVPGGVGGVTTSILVEHVVNAALLKMEASEK